MNHAYLTTPLRPKVAVTNVDEACVAQIENETHLTYVVAQLLAHRLGGIEQVRRFLNTSVGTLDEVLGNPMLLSDMQQALERLKQAIETKEEIVVYGDYDVDGITATILMVQVLEAWGANVTPFIPDRQTEGYGLSIAALERCLMLRQKRNLPKPTLIVTVDCGITAVEEIDWLSEQHQIEVLITDHHTPLDVLPKAVAVVNPHCQSDERSKDASGCATAFAIVRALAREGLKNGHALTEKRTPEYYLDLVALSTISDVMPLQEDNRILVARGLETMMKAGTGNRGIKEMLKVLKVAIPTVDRLAFNLCPCINAAGRLGTTQLTFGTTTQAYNLLHVVYQLFKLEKLTLAPLLDIANKKRREIERLLLSAIKEQVNFEEGQPLAIGGEIEIFHPGVLGIVASRVLEFTHAPVAIITRTSDGGGHGSMRSSPGYNAVEILTQLDAMLDHYGGHAEAAGFTLKPEMYDAFVKAFPTVCQKAQVDVEQDQIVADMDLSNIPITLKLCDDLEYLEPYGHANPRPTFIKSFVIDSFRAVGNGKHLALSLKPDDGGEVLKAVWFRGGERSERFKRGDIIRAIFTLEKDTYRDPCPCVQIQSLLNG